MARFQPGQSGNPKGKVPGTLSRRAQLAKLLEPHGEALINKAVELALAGDVVALRLCLERLLPKGEGQGATFILPQVGGKDTPTSEVVKDILSQLLIQLAGEEVSVESLKAIFQLLRIAASDFGASNRLRHEDMLKELE